MDAASRTNLILVGSAKISLFLSTIEPLYLTLILTMSAVRSMSLWAFPPTWQNTTRPSESSRRRRTERLTSRVSWSLQSRRTLGLATTRSLFQWRLWCSQGIAWAPLGARKNSLRTRRVRRKLSQRLPKEWQWKATQRILGFELYRVCIAFGSLLSCPLVVSQCFSMFLTPLARRFRYIHRSKTTVLDPIPNYICM